MIESDRVLIETTRTHRDRLASAFAFGDLERRRRVNTNLRRFIGSVVLAAVICVGCVGVSFVLDLLQGQREEEALASFRAAQAANPIPPDDRLVEDEETGFLRDTQTGELIDPQTGFVVDEDTGLARDPDGNTIDPRLDWFYDTSTGFYTDPETGVTIDPTTMQVVEEER